MVLISWNGIGGVLFRQLWNSLLGTILVHNINIGFQYLFMAELALLKPHNVIHFQKFITNVLNWNENLNPNPSLLCFYPRKKIFEVL
jgi:hypothetical protein